MKFQAIRNKITNTFRNFYEPVKLSFPHLETCVLPHVSLSLCCLTAAAVSQWPLFIAKNGKTNLPI